MIIEPGREATRISRRAIATGLLGIGIEALMIWRFGWSPGLPAYLSFGVLAAVVTVSDVTEHRIPSVLVLPAYPVAAALLVLACAPDGPWWPLGRAAISSALAVTCYLLCALAAPGQLGLGDVRLAGALAWFLGFLGWLPLIWGNLLGWMLGAVFVVVVCRHVRRRRDGVLPFGPFLVAGALVAIVVR